MTVSLPTGSTARNAAANLLQVLICALLLFVLYLHISTTLGVDKLGVWSVVLATASASRLADLGLSAGVTRFVARHLALAMPNKAAQVVETVTVTLALLVALFLVGIYSFIDLLLAQFFDAVYLPQALEVLPYALISLWLAIVASVAQSGLDGCQRMALRAVIVVLAQLLMVALAFALIPQWGLLGLAWAQIVQGVALLVGSWLVLRGSLTELSLLPWRWSGPVFRDVLGYGANVQVANVFMMLLDPLTKVLMARFGGPAAAGYFEMANQVVVRARTLIVAANQAIVPRVAHLMEAGSIHLPELYQENIRMLVLIALPIHALLFAWAGLFSEMLLGVYQAQFVLFSQVSALAWLFNTLSAPAYFVNMGTGKVGLNALSHATMGVLNVVLSLFFGKMNEATGVAWGYALALMIGSVFLMHIFHTRHGIRWRALMLVEHLPLAGVCLGISVFSIASLDSVKADWGTYLHWGMSVFLPLVALSVTLLLHPQRSALCERISGVLPRKSEL